MCRLFGFRSTIPSQVHRSLMAADNALSVQSNKHPDGWGVAYYVDGSPHITRSPSQAVADQLFHRVSGVVASQTVLAHVRKATQGDLTVLNCHPFQYGRWTMAHNGDIKNFSDHKETLKSHIAEELQRYVLGDTDSEVVFFIFLTFLKKLAPLADTRLSTEEVIACLEQTTALVRSLCDTKENQALLTIIVTDGSTMAGIQGGKELYWSTYKTRCSDRDTCASLSQSCEAPTDNGLVNHLVFSSEPLDGENVWLEMKPGQVVGVDWRMRLCQRELASSDRAKQPLRVLS